MLDVNLWNYDPNTPSFYVMLFTALMAFVLSAIIAITYEFSTKSIYRKAHFLQALTLIGIAAATVMQAIGESIAIGLGIIGALSIIRFRTTLNDPRNITFMFASLAAGIACGVQGYTIAVTGTLVFCLGAIILRFSPMSNTTELIGQVRLQVPKEDGYQKEIEARLKKHCRNIELEQLRFLNPKKVQKLTEQGIPTIEEVSRANLQEFTYLIRLRDKSNVSELEEALRELDGLEDFRLNLSKRDTRL